MRILILTIILTSGICSAQVTPFFILSSTSGGGGAPTYSSDADTIIATNRDANSSGTANEWLEYDGEDTQCGNEGGTVWRWGGEFQLNISQGATIDSAFVFFTTTFNNVEGSANMDIKVYDVDNAPIFDASHTHSLETHATVSTTVVSAWAFPSTTGRIKSPDIKTLVQIPINRAGWAANQYIGLVMVPNTFPTDKVLRIGDYEGAVTNNTGSIWVYSHTH
jgi:hypothetical protein